jgi:RND family efflux transporter MFP subunit
LERATPLAQSKVMNDFEYLDITSAYKSASSLLENSRDEARALLAQARQNRSQLQMREKDFSDSKILAPDGTTPDGRRIDSYAIVDRKISVGEYLREGSALFTIVADSTLRLQSHVPERYLGDVKKDATVSFTVEAFPGETFEGKVSIIDPAVDPASRTFQIEAIVDNTRYGNRLRPGSFVPGEVLTKKEPNRMMVPLTAVMTFVGVTKLFKVDNTTSPPTVKAVVVTTGQGEVVKGADGRDEHWIEIVKADQGGVNPADQVATSGLNKLVNGSSINVRAAETRPAAGDASAAMK